MCEAPDSPQQGEKKKKRTSEKIHFVLEMECHTSLKEKQRGRQSY